ncbi:MAG: serine/threonine dehydratase [Arthrobacter sp.]|jgi:threonine dehydratase|nr:serine/threonine dehydratase [Arthrobacter sp.]
MLSHEDVRAAHELIAGRVRETPMSEWAPGLVLKHEYQQLSGTFKARGAFARQLGALASGELNPSVGVVAASGGNAGLAHALVAARLGHPCEVFVPGVSPESKVKRLEAAGATVHRAGRVYAEAYAAAQERVAATGATFCHAYDQPAVVAGAGTLGLELHSQLKPLQRVVVSVGGGGLLAGLLAGLEPHVEVVAVESEGCPTLASSLAAGRPVDIEVGGVAADSLGATRLGEIAWELVEASEPGRLRSVVVPDEEILAAQRLLWDDRRIVTEPAAAAALAAVTSGRIDAAPERTTAVILCGANSSPAVLA